MKRIQKLYLDEMQKDAVMEAVRHGLMILTGGPGTGKTTTINAMIHSSKAKDWTSIWQHRQEEQQSV